MPRQPNIVPTVQIELQLPLDLRTQLELHLFSELEGRVPYGQYTKFFIERLREYFSHERLDLAPYLIGLTPGAAVISGPPAALMLLKRMLEA